MREALMALEEGNEGFVHELVTIAAGPETAYEATMTTEEELEQSVLHAFTAGSTPTSGESGFECRSPIGMHIGHVGGRSAEYDGFS